MTINFDATRVQTVTFEDGPALVHMSVEGAPTLNLSNSNAGWLLSLMGVPQEDRTCGSMNAGEFLVRVLDAAEGLRPHVGWEAMDSCQVASREYAHERLGDLANVAIAAIRLQAQMSWA